MKTENGSARPLPPGATIGILGGGQLGRMLAMAGARLGLKSHVYSDEPDAPAFQVAHAYTLGRYDDEAALKKFSEACDLVTFTRCEPAPHAPPLVTGERCGLALGGNRATPAHRPWDVVLAVVGAQRLVVLRPS